MRATRLMLIVVGLIFVAIACEAQTPQCTQCVQCLGYPGGRKACDTVETWPSGIANCQSVGDCNGCNGWTHCTRDPGRPTLQLVAVQVNGQRYARVGRLFRPVALVAVRRPATN